MKNTLVAVCLWVIGMMATAAEPSMEDYDRATAGVPRCRRGDPALNKCLERTIQASLPLLLHGNPKLGLPAMQPLVVDKLDFRNKGAGLKLYLFDVHIVGIGNVTFHDVDANLDKHKVVVGVRSPLVSITGRYSIKFPFQGEVIEGKGHSEMNFTDVEASVVVHGEQSVRHGRQYVRAHLDGDVLTIGGLSVNFRGLFNNDLEREEKANKLLNEQWEQLWNALEAPLDAGYGKLLSQISKALSSLPLATIFDDP